ncbi:hypothetical protein K458DRAFT_383637 [Lentithecium fluviatile CBS 122367]|uniref:Uncharacterized protein n=1 Tax=Lentithecium fluviatile CBS 122367 TaxID=1168545 RepID=A0A6G1JJB8_9PLEO|nr:hypothetical protein K458DRAFT_383637 [Lentithecium fluviatile CBS 122367]
MSLLRLLITISLIHAGVQAVGLRQILYDLYGMADTVNHNFPTCQLAEDFTDHYPPNNSTLLELGHLELPLSESNRELIDGPVYPNFEWWNLWASWISQEDMDLAYRAMLPALRLASQLISSDHMLD